MRGPKEEHWTSGSCFGWSFGGRHGVSIRPACIEGDSDAITTGPLSLVDCSTDITFPMEPWLSRLGSSSFVNAAGNRTLPPGKRPRECGAGSVRSEPQVDFVSQLRRL